MNQLKSKATKIEVKWGNTVYETIGVAYYTHYYYDNLRDFQDAYNLAKSLECDLTGNLDSFRLVIKGEGHWKIMSSTRRKRNDWIDS